MNILPLNMLLPYLTLSLLIIGAHKARPFIHILMAGQFALAFACGIIDIRGLIALVAFWAICEAHLRKPSSEEWINSLAIFFKAAIAICFASHVIPGFHNVLALNTVKVSPASSPFNLYLNFDKTMAAFILAAASGQLLNGFVPGDKKALKDTLMISVLCIAVMIPVATLNGYIHFDPKFHHSFWLWAFNNLLFVCFAEEVIFRGVIQSRLMLIARQNSLSPYSAIVVASILYGTLLPGHFQGGIQYMAYATLAGMFYGYAYYRTGRLKSAMLVHFLLNLAHFLLFTYPSALVAVR